MMIRILTTLILAVAATLCSAAQPALQLAERAPQQHIVVRGDTLWDISATFLKEPWRWPEIWRMNREQIKNPHLIYPGDIILLERDADGNPLLRVKGGRGGDGNARLQPKIYSEQIEQAIPAIPPNVIEPFISVPLIVDVDGLDSAPRIVATQQDRVFLGNGDIAYVENADPAQLDWQVYRNGKALLDPVDDKQVLGYEAFYLGAATQIRPGDPATFEIKVAKQEIGRGDRLVPAARPSLVSYVPHKPESAVDGRVISIYGGVGSAGPGSIVSLNLGTRNGLEIGHVVALERNRTVVGRDENDRKINVLIPPERQGLAFIFRTFERISYGLIVQAEGTIAVNDYVRTP